ncbi:hypothetical protein FisN_13Lh161 [Fistulifera solaris]|uniref:Tudor domain-containing protein n=1 Tax=Fistulifera solaris TaxID=1519565 RepID=A0A1Z5KLS7_FISSO|nr:hypothetical protein FisN_13Lh161 [Fistulifera solaris]|eukprot:GAX27273.1 hypothetical protein FisN_13Lh161 [Fistulifera solaris]
MNRKREVTKSNASLIGRRCAVYFELAPCFFREGQDVKSGEGYFLGEVVDRCGKNNLAVRFDDLSEGEYSHKEVRFVETSKKNPNHIVLSDEPDKVVATLDPVNVVPGDIVQANYDGSTWYRGRVAFVDTSNGTCDVAYDDGEYQTGVNIRKHIMLISKGADNPTWLAGLPVCFPNTSGQVKKGRVADKVEKKARVVVIYEDKKTKAFSYFSIASAIFLSVRMQPDRTILAWPAPRAVITTPLTSKEKSPVLATITMSTLKTEENCAGKSKANTSMKSLQSKEKSRVLASLSAGKSKTEGNVDTKASLEIGAARSSRNSSSLNAALDVRSSRGSLKKVSYVEYDSDVVTDESDLVEYNPPVRTPGTATKTKQARKISRIKAESDDDEDFYLVKQNAATTKKSPDATKKTRSAWRTTIDLLDSSSEQERALPIETPKSTNKSEANKKRKAVPRQRTSDAESENDASLVTKKHKSTSTAQAARYSASKLYGTKDRDGNPVIKLGPCREPTYFGLATDVVEMGESESDVYLSSLDSSESFVGKRFLTVTCMFHKRVPSAHHCKRLVDLLTYGPGTTSRTFFPDHNRMENAMKTFRMLVIQLGLADHIVSGLASDYLIKVMDQSSALYYTIAGDESRYTPAALQRLGLSFHARACGLEALEILLKHQLRGCLGVASPRDVQYQRRPLVLQVMNYSPLGPKGVMKEMAKNYVRFWTQYGHFIDGNFCVPSDEDNPGLLEENFDFVRAQAYRVAASLGRTLSYICSLRGSTESMKVVGLDLGNFLKDELESSKFATNDMVLGQDQNLIDSQGKINMIAYLDETIIPDVLPTLAETFEVVDSFNTIYGLLGN